MAEQRLAPEDLRLILKRVETGTTTVQDAVALRDFLKWLGGVPDVSTSVGSTKLGAELLEWFRERARCHDAVHPGALLRHIDVLESELALRPPVLKKEFREIERLQEHISALEKSLENTRKERDEAIRIGKQFETDARKHFEQSCANLQRAEKAERERDVALTHVSRLEEVVRLANAEVDRLKPSGQVAEDVEAVQRGLGLNAGPSRIKNAWAAAERLAAKAQGYDVAVADNAALLKALTATRDELDEMVGIRAGEALRAACRQPHPGTALLERMKRLEHGVRILLGAWPSAATGSMEAIHTYIRGVFEDVAQCQDGSCARCRSGEPCH